MTHWIRRFGVLLLSAAAIAAAAQTPPPTPVRWSVQQAPESVKSGQILSIQVLATIDEGWHLYALDPVERGPIPTRITAGPAPDFTLEEQAIDRPEPKRAEDPNFGIETAYYDERVTFGLPIKVAADLPAGKRELEVTARFQACNDQICLRPQTSTMKIALTVRR